ncbi:MAG: pyridoxamine 5'-phosphate oxidase [Dehalococcoidia bacterium]|nr:pyridoxamine 5'-phosphate oxidase [Dehalococcoidia bacterium]
MTSPQPRIDHPVMPKGYGVPDDDSGLLPWSWAEERLTAADNFWFSTTRPDGRPHAMPAWGAWLDGALYFEGSPETRRARNLAGNPNLSIHLENAVEVVILEGVAEDVPKPPRGLSERLSQIFTAKYGGPPWEYKPEPTQWDDGGLWLMRPRVAFGWSSFPTDTTRWRFGT